jgi:hypothetical protein
MVHIPDLAPMEHPQLIAVGWLARDEPYTRGPIDQEFADALVALLQDPWQPAVTAGIHHCELAASRAVRRGM